MWSPSKNIENHTSANIIEIPSSPPAVNTTPSLSHRIQKSHTPISSSKGLIIGRSNHLTTRQVVERFRQASIKRSQADKISSRIPPQFGLSSNKSTSHSSYKSSKPTTPTPVHIGKTIISSATRKLVLWAGNADSIGWASFIRLGTLFYFLIYFYILVYHLFNFKY